MLFILDITTHLVADLAWNLLSLLMGNGDVKGEIVAGKVLLGTGGHWALKIFNLGMRLETRTL